MEGFAAAVQATNRPGLEALTARMREHQARGNEILAVALERARETDLHGRLHSLADGAEELITG